MAFALEGRLGLPTLVEAPTSGREREKTDHQENIIRYKITEGRKALNQQYPEIIHMSVITSAI